MIELAKHIEVLLLENDCVIVPGLGGFIAHYRPASILSDGGICPPSRTIGFNPRLTINDGLLVQSYMNSYNTDFPDATRKIERVVIEIKDILYKEGQFLIHNVGTLYNNVNGTYEFRPCDHGFFTPFLYGLGEVHLPVLELVVENTDEMMESPHTELPQPQDVSVATVHQPVKRLTFLKYAASVAAAIILFFLFSPKVENTYVDKSEYAALGSKTLIDAIRMESVVMNAPVEKPKSSNKTIRPVAVKTVKVAPRNETAVGAKTKASETKQTERQETVKNHPHFYIIVASMNTEQGAKNEVTRLKQLGYSNLEIISTTKIHRVAIAALANENDAYAKLNELRKDNRFANAWVFTKK